MIRVLVSSTGCGEVCVNNARRLGHGILATCSAFKNKSEEAARNQNLVTSLFKMVRKYTGQEILSGKTVIITGANTGIGKETARDLARRGGRIILACRNLEKGENARREIAEDTNNQEVIFKELDLSSFASIQKFAKDFNETESRLDILINNAGVMACPKMLTQDGLEMQIGTNHFGHFLLTELVMDKLKASSPSRIVILSSAAHSWGTINFEDLNSEKSYSSFAAYQQSKLANVLHALELSNRLKGTGVTVNSVHPGIVNTELARYMNSACMKCLLVPLAKFVLLSPEQGAQTTLHCALNPKLENVSAKYFADCREKTASCRARNEEDARRLWTLTEEIIHSKLPSTPM
ncbi:hypothetical protein RRG08_018866 [Elysia crispata]|uniref:Uncharacterized protein n=1 Tax=Elysia crispata TaxID=231223 RepID=A0AAE1B778_9GAST|nr:hypothetical protein RRG08_018866 [Elysia crispata]